MATPTALGQMSYKGTPLDSLILLANDYYRISLENYESTIYEGKECIDLYHNRQYTAEQLQSIKDNGQPAETFNIVKMFSHAVIGYLATVASQINVEPRYMSSSSTAMLLNDLVEYTLDKNDFDGIDKKMKLDGLLTGLMVVHEDVQDTGVTDKYGRKIFDIKLSHIPSWQCRLDPQSQLDDYSDARFLHTFKWIPEAEVLKTWGQDKLDQLTEYYNFLDGDRSADYDRQYPVGRDIGQYKQYDNYLIIKTVLVDEKGKVWSLIWNDEVLLEKKEITFKEVRFPYRVTKMSMSDIAEYYGIFRDITETQKAINQALLQIQILVNTSKAFVEDNAVEDIEQFKELFSRINSVIPVVDLQGIRVEDMSRDVQAQYVIIDQALTRIKQVLGVNDSFLGQTFASDSGRKVALNSASTASQLTMIVDRIRLMHKLIGTDIVNLIKQYYRAEQAFRIADPLNTHHYIEINKPIQMPNGVNPATGEMMTMEILDEELDPETGKPMEDKDGNIIVTPLNTPESSIEFSEVDIKVVSSFTQNADERNQLMLETVLNGPAGQMMMQTAPAAYMRTLAMQISEFGTKHSLEVAKLMMDIAMGIEQGTVDPRLAMVGGDLQAIMGGAMGGSTGNSQNTQGPESPTLGLPKPGKEGGNMTQGGQNG